MISARPIKEPMTTPVIAPFDNLVVFERLVVFGGFVVKGGLVRFRMIK